MPSARRRPNLILIMTDQQRFDQIGYASGGHFQTPNLDRLARRGVIFESAYSGSTVCIPARNCLLTGLLDHRVPKANNSLFAMQEGFWTVAHALRQAGYVTALIGKMHFTPIHAAHGFDVMRMCEHLVRQAGYGPDDIDDYHKWLIWQGRADHQITHHFGPGLEQAKAEFDTWYSAVPFAHDRYFHPTEWVKRESIAFLEKRSLHEPFLLVVSFPHPHSPYDPPEPYASMFREADAVLPGDGFERNQGLSPAFRQAIEQQGSRAPEAVTRRILTFIRALLRHVDDAVGEILEHVDLQTTNVFFTSDHGDYSGHRGLIAKDPWISFDDLARVPFFCTGRDVAGGRRVAALVQSSDFALTALDLAGVEPPAQITDTQSLRSVLNGAPADAERAVFCCTSLDYPMVREGNLKFFLHAASGDELLFDLAKDPNETQNLIAAAEYAATARALRQRLRHELDQAVPALSRFDGPYTRGTTSSVSVGEPVEPADARLAAERIARAFTLLTTATLVPSSPLTLAEAACGALAARSVELSVEQATAAGLAKECEALLGDSTELYWAAIDAMVKATGDPHTRLLSAQAEWQMFATIRGDAVGAPGFYAHRTAGGDLAVSEVLPESPAALAGLACGDVIASIDGQHCREHPKLSDLWLRAVDTRLDLGLATASGERPLSLTLSAWTPPLASFRVLPGGSVGLIRVHLFAEAREPERSLSALTRAALSAFEGRGVALIVIDLRGSLGVAAMDAFVSLFTNKDPLALFRARDGSEAPVRRSGASRGAGRPLAVLVDEQTMTAAAFAASALEDLESALVVGMPTEPVLTLSRPHALGSGMSLYIPEFELVRASSREARPGRRLVPNLVVPNRGAEDLLNGRDPQLDAAVQAMCGQRP